MVLSNRVLLSLGQSAHHPGSSGQRRSSGLLRQSIAAGAARRSERCIVAVGRTASHCPPADYWVVSVLFPRCGLAPAPSSGTTGSLGHPWERCGRGLPRGVKGITRLVL